MKSKKTIQVIDLLDHIGETVSVAGWVKTIRDMGQIVFIELRDFSGVIQIVVDDVRTLPMLGSEYVIKVSGKVRQREKRYVNHKSATGSVEIGMESIEVLNESSDLPFELTKDTFPVHEETRLKYRYLDLRSDRLAQNLKLRHNVITFIRSFYNRRGFIEVETPLLTKGTPEGAREFLVPARLHPGKFYVLPQSPQQFKQLLMIGGVGNYYQIAKCLRDEDQRGDRQPEFTQLDLEMSFVEQEDVLQQTESMLIELTSTVTPNKKIQKIPFPRLTYAESMEKYGTDKPDLRKNKKDPDELAFVWVTDFPMFEKNKETGKPGAMHHPFTAPVEKDPKKIAKSDPFKMLSDAYDIVLNGYEIGGGSIRISNSELQRAVFEILGLSSEDIEHRFGHMLEAYKYGAPPHGGIAPGIDRIIMILSGEPNIREVIAFPKTGDARDPMMGAPTSVSTTALKEANIDTVTKRHPRPKK